MKNNPLRRGLAWGVAGCLLLPMVIVVSLGTGGLLAAVGDETAAAICRWCTVPLGVLWVVSIAATTVLSAALSLAPPERRRRPRERT